MHAALYLRQSLDKTGDELGIQRQQAECERLAAQRGYSVAHIVTDNSVSASTGKRPGYDRLLSLIEARQIEVVVVYRLDRLLRRLTDLEALIQLSERTGVQVATVQGDLDLTTSTGRLIGRILASVARGEVETKSERHKLANAQKAAAGKPHGSRRPYGYEADLVTLYEPEAALLREMGRRVIAGHSYKEVGWWMNAQGHTTTLGKSWYPVTVRNMLLKKRYGGIREYKGAEYPAVWQAVFDAATWERLQLTMKLRRQDDDAPRARKYLLTGLVYCGKCGLPLNGATKRDHPGRPLRRTYHCRVQGDTRRERGCGGVVRNADALEDWIKEAVIYRLDSPGLAELLSKASDDAELRAALGARQAQEQRLRGLAKDYGSGLLTRAMLSEAKLSAEVELDRLNKQVATLQRSHQANSLIPAALSVREAWDSSDSDEWRRQLLRLVIKQIRLLPGVTKPVYKQWRFDPNLVEVDWLH